MELFGIMEYFDVIKVIFMNKLTIVLAIGLFLGWNLPQPAKAKAFQDWVVKMGKLLIEKIKNKKNG